MPYLLFPGRHHLLTHFQLQYLTRITSGDPATLPDVDGQPLGLTEPITPILWAITSANHENTRRNPLPASRREVAIERFADELEVPSFVFLIDDLGTTDRFAEYVLKKIEVDSRGQFALRPDNTVVACSTPAVIAMYEKLDFRILPVELADRHTATYEEDTPWQLLNELGECAAARRDWRRSERFLTMVAPATRRLYLKYDYGDRIGDLYRDPMLTEDGDLTKTRDYNTYVRSFDQGAERKFALIKDYVVPGRIVDVGCCTGALLRLLTMEDRLRESDFYGVEVARSLYVECLHRKEQGAFANDNVFFYHCNITAGKLFAPNSVHTMTTFALTHEIESYQGREPLQDFIRLMYEQLAMGGRWLNVDVLGPEDKDDEIFLWLNQDDGRNDDFDKHFTPKRREDFKTYLTGLSTYGLFRRFCQDFRRKYGYQVEHAEETVKDKTYVRLRLQDACEFMSKKDYLDNWQSEMHETFCFWSFSQWRQAVEDAGFVVHADSKAFTNPWIVENRFEGKVKLFRRKRTRLTSMAYPVTNMLMIAEKA